MKKLIAGGLLALVFITSPSTAHASFFSDFVAWIAAPVQTAAVTNTIATCPIGYICTPASTTTPSVIAPIICPAGYTCGSSYASFSNVQGILGTPILSQNTIVMQPVTFKFTINAADKPVYISTDANKALSTTSTGVLPSSARLISVIASPANISGDNSSVGYSLIPAGTSREFTYSGFINPANSASGYKTFQINAVYYGIAPSSLQSLMFNSANLKVSAFLGDDKNVQPATTTSTSVPVVQPTPAAAPAPAVVPVVTPAVTPITRILHVVAPPSSSAPVNVPVPETLHVNSGAAAVMPKVVVPVISPTLNPPTLNKTIQAGQSVSQVFVVQDIPTGNKGSWNSWTVAKGDLPAGLSLKQYGAFSGSLSGIPAAAGTYGFMIQGYDAADNLSAYSSVNLIVTPASAPAVSNSIPTNLTLGVGSSECGGKVALIYSANNATKYRVFRYTPGTQGPIVANWTLLADTSATSYIDTPPAKNTQYRYSVWATNDNWQTKTMFPEGIFVTSSSACVTAIPAPTASSTGPVSRGAGKTVMAAVLYSVADFFDAVFAK